MPNIFKKILGKIFIPEGIYCYKFPNKRCIFYSHLHLVLEGQEIAIPYCTYIDKADVGGLTDQEHELVDAYIKKENMVDYFEYLLLWDCCKECGVNDDFY